MKTSEYLDALKHKLGVDSDYSLHKILGVTRSAISQFRHDKVGFSDDLSAQVAELLDIPVAIVLIDMQLNKSQSKPQLLAAWTGIREKFSQGVHASFNSVMSLICRAPTTL